MNKEMTREDTINDLLDLTVEGNDTADIKELLRGSWKGYDDYTDEELIKEYWGYYG